MLSGQLRERRFAWAPDGTAGPEVDEEPVVMDASVPSKSVGFMHDSLGLHRIENPSADEVAVSLHIYSPPFRECLVFPPTGGSPKTAPMVSIFSPESQFENGRKLAPSSEDFVAPPSLQDFCTSLGKLHHREASGPVDAHAVLDLLGPAEMSPMEWASFASPAHFSEFQPVQHVIHCDDEFSVVVTCWSPGQRVPPHTVGRGRSMWLKVMHGNMVFQEYAPGLFPWESDVETSKTLHEGSSSILEECAVRMHDLWNKSETEPAVTVQVFSPPLTSFTFHTERGSERRDLPRIVGQDAKPLGHNGEANVRALGRTAGRWFLSFSGLRGLLNEEFSRSDLSEMAISSLLRKAVFNPDEWRERLASALPQPAAWGTPSEGLAAPKYVLLAQEKHYSVLLSFWVHSSHQRCVARERGTGRRWTLVLEGELEEQAFAEGDNGPVMLRSGMLKEDSLSFLGEGMGRGSEWIERCHDSDSPCVSLHIYHPRIEGL